MWCPEVEGENEKNQSQKGAIRGGGMRETFTCSGRYGDRQEHTEPSTGRSGRGTGQTLWGSPHSSPSPVRRGAPSRDSPLAQTKSPPRWGPPGKHREHSHNCARQVIIEGRTAI